MDNRLVSLAKPIETLAECYPKITRGLNDLVVLDATAKSKAFKDEFKPTFDFLVNFVLSQFSKEGSTLDQMCSVVFEGTKRVVTTSEEEVMFLRSKFSGVKEELKGFKMNSDLVGGPNTVLSANLKEQGSAVVIDVINAISLAIDESAGEFAKAKDDYIAAGGGDKEAVSILEETADETFKLLSGMVSVYNEEAGNTANSLIQSLDAVQAASKKLSANFAGYMGGASSASRNVSGSSESAKKRADASISAASAAGTAAL